MNLNLYLEIFLLVWCLLISIILGRLFFHYRGLTSGVSKKDLLSSLNHLISMSDQNSDDIKQLNQKIDKESAIGKLHFQKLGFIRFNPFTDTGGDQSFALCLLDENGTGFVVSSLHSRENTRLYAKKIEQAKPVGNVVLSKEEQEVIKQAINNS